LAAFIPQPPIVTVSLTYSAERTKHSGKSPLVAGGFSYRRDFLFLQPEAGMPPGRLDAMKKVVVAKKDGRDGCLATVQCVADGGENAPVAGRESTAGLG